MKSLFKLIIVFMVLALMFGALYSVFGSFGIELDGIFGDKTDVTTKEPTETKEPIETKEPDENCTHTWDKGKVITEPTCQKEGKKLFTCTLCKGTKEDVIKKVEHKYGEVEKISGNKEQHMKKCSVCGNKQYLEHEFKETVVSATCTNPKTKNYKCLCGYSYKITEGEPNGHSFDFDTSICTVCGYKCNHLDTFRSGNECVSWVECVDCMFVYPESYDYNHYIDESGFCRYCGQPCTHESCTQLNYDRCPDCGELVHNLDASGRCLDCNFVCSHLYTREQESENPDDPCGVNLVCDDCHQILSHSVVHTWKGYICEVCMEYCLHQNGVDADGNCSVCGSKLRNQETCTHNYRDSVCVMCGLNCPHNWNNGICSDCELECSHTNTHEELGDGCVSHSDVCSDCGHFVNIYYIHTFDANGKCTVCGATQ